MSSEAIGRVYEDLTERELTVLDAFEDPAYAVEPLDLTNGRRSLAYVWPDESLAGTWTAGSLDDGAMSAYLDRCVAWRSRFEARSSPRQR